MSSIVAWSAPEKGKAPLRTAMQAVARRWTLICFIILALNALAFAAVTRLTPRYTAEADVIISPRQQQIVDLKAVLAGLTGESDVIESEIQVMKSREIARGVVLQLNLDQLPEFNAALAAPGVGSQFASWVLGHFPKVTRLVSDASSQLLGQPHRPTAVQHPEAKRDPLSGSIDVLLRRLGVAPRGRSRVIAVTFDSADPALAAAVANAVADAYMGSQLSAKREATRAAHKWLNERVAELREQLVNADAAVQAFRRRSGLTQGRSGPLIAEQITITAEQVAKAMSVEAEMRARLDAASAGKFRAQGLEQASQAAREHVAALEKSLSDLRKQADAADQSEVELRVLQREADALRALYDRLLLRLNETNIESGLQLADSQIISRAEIPADPTFPHVFIIQAVVFVASCLFAGLLILVLDGLEEGYTAGVQVERQLGLPVLGMMPAVRCRLRQGVAPETLVLSPLSANLREAVRGIFTSILLSKGHAPPRVILIASAEANDGKSSTVLALGRLMALCGKRVAIVDCDFHRGRLHKACGTSLSPGLMDYLAGHASLDEVIHPDSRSPASLIPAGFIRNSSPDLIGSDRMEGALHALSTRYDMVLLDSAPLLSVSDTRNLCRFADRTILLVRWKHTKQSAAAAAARYIIEGGGHLAGCLLTKVDARQYARYDDNALYRAYLEPQTAK